MKEVIGFEGYFVNEDGQVFSNKSGRILPMSVQENQDGYYVVNLRKGGKYFHRRVNRLVAETFIPNPENLPVVHHKDDDRKNNNVSNLEWCTSQQNNSYKVERGRHSLGEVHGMAELTDDQVVEIYYKLLNGAPLSIGEDYGVSERTISRIKSRSGWKHVLKSLPEIPIKNKRSKLTDAEVRSICERLVSGERQKEIADSLSIDRQVVFRIRRGKSFKHITDEYNFS